MRHFIVPCVALLSVIAGTCATAQSYPHKPIRLVAPFPPGGGTGDVARVIAQTLGAQLGQPVNIEAIGGNSGVVGTDIVAKAPADGYTLLLGSSGTHAVMPNLTKTPYHPLRDFTPVSLAALSGYMLVVHPNFPAKTVRQLIALSRPRPGQLTYASSGVGTMIHFSGELFQHMTGVKWIHVPYRNSGLAADDLIWGNTLLMFGNVPSVIPPVREGKLRALAVTYSKRSSAVPDIPTVEEAGVPGYESTQFYGIMAPARIPKDVLERLNREMVRAIADANVSKVMLDLGLKPNSDTPDEFVALIRREMDKWGNLIKVANIKGQ
jgi:tripartite-type tricarboxylate transporter receptor subunit TctC